MPNPLRWLLKIFTGTSYKGGDFETRENITLDRLYDLASTSRGSPERLDLIAWLSTQSDVFSSEFKGSAVRKAFRYAVYFCLEDKCGPDELELFLHYTRFVSWTIRYFRRHMSYADVALLINYHAEMLRKHVIKYPCSTAHAAILTHILLRADFIHEHLESEWSDVAAAFVKHYSRMSLENKKCVLRLSNEVPQKKMHHHCNDLIPVLVNDLVESSIDRQDNAEYFGNICRCLYRFRFTDADHQFFVDEDSLHRVSDAILRSKLAFFGVEILLLVMRSESTAADFNRLCVLSSPLLVNVPYIISYISYSPSSRVVPHLVDYGLAAYHMSSRRILSMKAIEKMALQPFAIATARRINGSSSTCQRLLDNDLAVSERNKEERRHREQLYFLLDDTDAF